MRRKKNTLTITTHFFYDVFSFKKKFILWCVYKNSILSINLVFQELLNRKQKYLIKILNFVFLLKINVFGSF